MAHWRNVGYTYGREAKDLRFRQLEEENEVLKQLRAKTQELAGLRNSGRDVSILNKAVIE